MTTRTFIITLLCIFGIISIVCICVSIFDESDQYGNWPLQLALTCNVLAGIANIILQKRKS